MTDYEKVTAALSTWQPSRGNAVFGITAIKQIVPVKFFEAVAIKKRLQAEGLIVDGEPVRVEQLRLF